MIIILVTILIITLILFAVAIQEEGFKTTYSSSYNTDKDNLQILNDKTLFNNIKNINSVIDPNDYKKYFPYLNGKDSQSSGYFLYLSKTSSTTCSFNLENKTIGYISRSDLYFIRSIIYGYRMNEKLIRIKKLNPIVPDFNSVDFSILYVYPNSQLYNTISKQNIFVEGFDNIDVHRIRLFYPSIEFENIRIKELFPQNNVLTSNDRFVRVPSTNMINIENFITRINIKDNVLNEQYGCFGQPETDNAMLCNSIYDELGNKKTYWSVWSKKCEYDTDCPYYKANMAYPNEFGGCTKNSNEKYGTCEGPIGVKQIGFTKFYTKGKYAPFCESSDDVKKTCNRFNEDYRFEGDQELRKQNNLPI